MAPLTAVAGPASRRKRIGSCGIRLAGPVQVLPLRFVLAIAVEDLDAVVFAVVDLDPAAEACEADARSK
jgi:hypothetical protein